MKELITKESKKPLIDAYLNNPLFHAIVTKHEIDGSEYSVMLEDAVILLVKEIAIKNDLVTKYVQKFGLLDDEIK